MVLPLIPSLIGIVSDAVNASNGDEQVAIGILMGILGTSEETKTRAALAIAKARALKEFGNL